MLKRIEIWLFQGVKVDEIPCIFHGAILPALPPAISQGIHSPGPPELCLSWQKPHVQVERLLGAVKLQ